MLCLVIFTFKMLRKTQLESFTMENNIEQVSRLLFPDGTELNKTASQQFSDDIRRQILNMRNQRLKTIASNYQNEVENNQDYKEIADFIREHVMSVGKEGAVKDFQCGLNFLHKDLKEALKEDGDFGEKTFRAFYEVFKHYDIEIIKNAIRKGALSNTIIGTTSDEKVDTQRLVNKIENNLGEINHG